MHGIASCYVLHGGSEFADVNGSSRPFQSRACVSVEGGARTCGPMPKNSHVVASRVPCILMYLYSLYAPFSILYVVHSSVPFLT